MLTAGEQVVEGLQCYHSIRFNSVQMARQHYLRAIKLKPTYGIAYKHLACTYEVPRPALGVFFRLFILALLGASGYVFSGVTGLWGGLLLGWAAIKILQIYRDKQIPLERNYVFAVQFYQQALENGEVSAQTDLNRLLNATNLSVEDCKMIGAMYYRGGNDITPNVEIGNRWYAKMVEQQDLIAAYQLGLCYEKGDGDVPQDTIQAVKYYEQVFEKGNAKAGVDLERLLQSPEISTDNCIKIGKMYGRGNGVKKNAIKAEQWYQKAKNLGSTTALHSLGRLCVREKKMVDAVKYYQQALEKGATSAQDKLTDLLNNKTITANTANTIAILYHNADGITRDYVKAKQWYEKAIEKGSKLAHRNMGLLFEYGLGFTQDRESAATCYQRAIEAGYADASTDLERVLNALLQGGKLDSLLQRDVMTHADCNCIGSLYRNAHDYIKAREWYERGISKKSPGAHKNLGMLYEMGHGCEKDLVRAAAHYRSAYVGQYYPECDFQVDYERLLADTTLSPKTQRALEREFEKIVLHVRARKPDYINQKDRHNDTLLHRSAKKGLLKNCARFLLLCADKNVLDAGSNKPFSHLKSPQQKRVVTLQSQLSESLQKLRVDIPAPDYLASRFFVDHSRMTDAQVKSALRELYELELIRPLIDFAKLCVLALHDGARRTKWDDPDYDSDRDADECLNETEQKLTIRIGGSSRTCEDVYHAGTDGQYGGDAYGLYAYGNTLFLGGARAGQETRGTLVHELTHFITHELFKNTCKPYHEHSKEEQDFTAIVLDLHARKARLDSIMQHVFDSSYQKTQWHSEVIVRVPQILVSYPDGLRRLERRMPALLAYYKNVFLVAVRERIQALEERALSGWDKALFDQVATAREPFALEQAFSAK